MGELQEGVTYCVLLWAVPGSGNAKSTLTAVSGSETSNMNRLFCIQSQSYTHLLIELFWWTFLWRDKENMHRHLLPLIMLTNKALVHVTEEYWISSHKQSHTCMTSFNHGDIDWMLVGKKQIMWMISPVAKEWLCDQVSGQPDTSFCPSTHLKRH